MNEWMDGWMKFITAGGFTLIGPGGFCHVHFDTLICISYEPLIRHPVILTSLDSVADHIEGRLFQVHPIGSS